MNRLIIVGNGFDLAHGLPTSYCDFIKWYIKNAFKKATEEGTHKDDLLIVICEDPTAVYQYNSFTNSDQMVDFFLKKIGLHELIFLKTDKIIIDGRRYNFPFKITIPGKSNLLQKIILEIDKLGWVDVELEYYSILKEILNTTTEPYKIKEKLTEINSSLSELSEQLLTYLNTLDKPKAIESIRTKIYSEIKEPDFLITKSDQQENDIKSDELKNITFLNFNYTSTINQYVTNYWYREYHKMASINIINIHGQINDKSKYPIVFGFGDELDEDYKRMENSKIKGYFQHAKSFAYFQNHSYSDLVRFIESDKFQVFIFGHSCGLSDRTLLNMIFEHDNCKSIKIYYHKFEDGTTTFRETTEEISRHFKDKVKMRNRVVNFEISKALVD